MAGETKAVSLKKLRLYRLIIHHLYPLVYCHQNRLDVLIIIGLSPYGELSFYGYGSSVCLNCSHIQSSNKRYRCLASAIFKSFGLIPSVSIPMMSTGIS